MKRVRDSNYYFDRLVKYCKERGGYVLEHEWTSAKEEYNFKCGNPSHPIFKTTADALYSGNHWCPYCSGRNGNFEDEIISIICKKDGELLSNYSSAFEHVTVKCNKHNYVWDIMPSNLKKGRWCPICNMGFNEKVVWDYLKNMDCSVKVQYGFENLLGQNNEKLKFDFALFNTENQLTYLIEIDDEEHRDNHAGTTPRQLSRQRAQKRDKQKDSFCIENNIPLYRMNVPFRGFKKWAYEDYYHYINTELKEIVNISRK